MAQAEIVARRRKWKPEEKAALLAEVEAEGGRISVVVSRQDEAGLIEIELPNGIQVRVDAFVNEKALSRILRAMKGWV